MSLPQAQAEDVSVFGKGVAPCLAGTGKKCYSFYHGKGHAGMAGRLERGISVNAATRRQKIEDLLRAADGPLSASNIAACFAVSRQIIVGDIAIMRAGGLRILATPRGYILEQPSEGKPAYYERSLACTHDKAHSADELYTVIDQGGAVIDVTVEHSIYGEISAPLHLFSRFDVDVFMEKLEASDVRPLFTLTGGPHLHRIRCADETVFARIRRALREKNYLYEKEGE